MPAENNSFKIYNILRPFAFLYGIGIKIRNLMFDWGILPSEEYPVPVISVGNLAAGGTGKTPHIEYLIRLLKDQYKLAVLSRGYKRTTSGYILADDAQTSLTIGDEPFQMKHKFPDIIVAVDENRRRGIKNLLQMPEGERPEVILLDDAYQHRYVKPSLSIVTTDYHRLFYEDALLPAGLLREPRSASDRANIIIVTKCPNSLKPIDFRIISDDMKPFPYQHLFFTHIVYAPVEPVFPMSNPDRLTWKNVIEDNDGEILLVAGIASSGLFVEEVKTHCSNVRTMLYPDHYAFDAQDLRKIAEAFGKMTSPNKYILMTEKDAMRMMNNPNVPEELQEAMFYLPIRIGFTSHTEVLLDDVIKNHIFIFRRNFIPK